MEEEIQQLIRQLDRLKKRESFPNHHDMLEASKQLRIEKERTQELTQLRSKQRNQLLYAQDNLLSLKQTKDCNRSRL